MTRTRMITRVFVDDGWPEASDYDNNYVVVTRRSGGGLWRTMRVRLKRRLRLAWRASAVAGSQAADSRRSEPSIRSR